MLISWSEKKEIAKRSSNALLHLVFFFSEQMLIGKEIFQCV